MKNFKTLNFVLLVGVLFAACSDALDPLSPGSTDGAYSLGIKALVPLAVGNRWTYNVAVYDTTGAAKARYVFTLSVVDTVSADTSRIPLVPPNTSRKNMKQEALAWYLLQGELGVRTCWQVDSLENLLVRKSDDTRFFEQVPFNFRAVIGDISPARYVGPDTSTWASGDVITTGVDSVRTSLVSKGIDTLRTTLGSAPYFHYRQSYAVQTGYTDYYFKPGFGLVLVEKFVRKADGTMARVRRDELASYYFR
jgi:hypothetical protein